MDKNTLEEITCNPKNNKGNPQSWRKEALSDHETANRRSEMQHPYHHLHPPNQPQFLTVEGALIDSTQLTLALIDPVSFLHQLVPLIIMCFLDC